jgi:hypothetical protein
MRMGDQISPVSTICKANSQYHAVFRPCRSESDFSRTRQSAAGARHGVGELTSAVEKRPVGDLPRFGFFWPPRGVSRSLSSETQT